MASTTLMIASMLFILLGFAAVLIGWRLSAPSKIAGRLREFVSIPNEQKVIQQVSMNARRRELRGSIRTRVIMPLLRRIGDLISSILPGNLSEDMADQLIIADHPFGLQPRTFYFIRLVFMGLAFVIAYAVLQAGYFTSGPSIDTGSNGAFATIGIYDLLFSIFSFWVMVNLPKTWLKRRARKRQQSVRKTLPDALDMLSVCADAGLGFDQSLQRVSEYWENELALELRRLVRELGMGVSRRQALRNLSERLQVAELTSFVAVIIQSEQLGMSITDTLHAQAEQMRVERRFRAQEEARKMPLKMLFPLLLLIFPAMFAVILGPMVPVLGNFFSNLRSGL